MILNEKVIDYEVVVLIEIYNFGFGQFYHPRPFDIFLDFKLWELEPYF